MTTITDTPPADPSQLTAQDSYNLSAELEQILGGPLGELEAACTNSDCEGVKEKLGVLDEYFAESAVNNEEELNAVLKELEKILYSTDVEKENLSAVICTYYNKLCALWINKHLTPELYGVLKNLTEVCAGNRLEEVEKELNNLNNTLKGLTSEKLIPFSIKLTEIWKKLNEAEQRNTKSKLYEILLNNRPYTVDQEQYVPGALDHLNSILNNLLQDSPTLEKDLKAAIAESNPSNPSTSSRIGRYP